MLHFYAVMRVSLSYRAALLGLALACACKADKVQVAPEDKDAGVEETLEAPVLNAIPELTPNDTVAIRGTSSGKRVVIQGGTTGTTVTAVLPGGAFCGEAGLKSGEATTLTIYALGEGLLSPSTQAVVTKDASAPVPPAPTCSGSTPEQCDKPEDCGNEVDDNCDGWIDGCDLACSQCQDDSFEPNDFALNVPLIAKGTYSMAICPCREDWFAFERSEGQRVKVTADFVHATVDIDMRLFKADPGGTEGELVVSSTTTTNQEVIDTLVDESTLYLLRVYPFAAAGQQPGGPYQLKIE